MMYINMPNRPHVPGVQLAVDYFPCAQNKKAELTFIFLPGGPGSDRTLYVSQLAFFREWGNVVLMDPRGTGGSESSSDQDYHVSTYIDDVEAIRLHFNIHKGLVIVGGSYGSIVAQGYAIKYGAPHLKALTLLCGTSSYEFIEAAWRELHKRGTPDQVRQFEKLTKGEIINEEDLKQYYETMMPLYSVRADKDPEEFKQVFPKYEKRRGSPQALTAGFRPGGFLRTPEFDYRPHLSRITCPTLIIGGAEDWILPPGQQAEMARLIKGSELFIIKNASHLLFLDQATAYQTIVKGFLQKLG